MRREISFMSKGANIRGWLYIPDHVESKASAVVMAHGFTGVKEQVLPDFAEKFAAEGLVTLVFDYRFFGESEGEPRSQVFPLEMVEDVRNAITWVSYQAEVDPERIGLWGTSFGCGIVLYAGTYDKRVKAVVAQVPMAPDPAQRRARNPARYDAMNKMLLRDRVARYRTGDVNYIKVVSDSGEPCLLPGKEAYNEYMAIEKPNWCNQVTLESLEKMREFDPVSMIHMMSPTALLFIAGESDSFFPVGAVKRLYERAGEPKQLSVFPIMHFEAYGEPWLSRLAEQAIKWFKNYL